MTPSTTDIASSSSTEETTFVIPEVTTGKDETQDLATTAQSGSPDDIEEVTDASLDTTTARLDEDKPAVEDGSETTTTKGDEGAVDGVTDDAISASTEGTTIKPMVITETQPAAEVTVAQMTEQDVTTVAQMIEEEGVTVAEMIEEDVIPDHTDSSVPQEVTSHSTVASGIQEVESTTLTTGESIADVIEEGDISMQPSIVTTVETDVIDITDETVTEHVSETIGDVTEDTSVDHGEQVGAESTTLPASTAASTTTQPAITCTDNDIIYQDTEAVPNTDPCKFCTCNSGSVVCAERICSVPNGYDNCTPLTKNEGECCPATFMCGE